MTTVRWIFLAALLLANSVFAGAPVARVDHPLDAIDLGAPTFTTFSARDGVPDSVIVSVQTDREGFTWLASAQGLARYDGQHWNAVDPPAIKGSIGYLLVDHEGVLWASFRDRGIAHFDAGEWHFDDHHNGLPTDHVRRLSETVDTRGRHELWAPTLEAGLLVHDHGRWIAGPDNSQLPAGPLLSVARTQSLGGHERLWVGTFNEGLWYHEDVGGWQRFRDSRFDPAQVEHLLRTERDGHEELWISAFGNGLWRLDEHGMRAWSVALGDLPTNEIYDIAKSTLPGGDEAIWVGSRSGLVRIHNDHAQSFDRRNGLPSDAIRGLSVWHTPDGADVLWLATEAGVARTIVGANQWQTATLMGTHGVGVFGLLIEPDNRGGERLWIASSGDGLGLYQDGRWQQFTQAEGFLPEAEARMIKRAPDDDGESALWLGMRSGYLLRVREGPRFESVAIPWELHPGQAVMDVIGRKFDGRYERWFATRQSGIYRWRDGAWSAFRPDSAVGQWRVVRLLEQIDAQQRSWLWASSNQGLARFDGHSWSLLGRDIGLPDPGLAGITLIPDSRGEPVLWAGSAISGMIRVNVSDPMHPKVLPADLPPPPDPTVYGAVRDSKGRIYICTNAGVQLLTPNAAGYDSRVFTRSDGMVHEECNTNAQLIDNQDRFWTGTLGGATVFDPVRGMRDRRAKPLKLTGMRIDGTSIHESALQVPPGAHALHFEFALLSWQRELESQFRSQLVGYDAAPGAWNSQNYRDFNVLPAGGDYTLLIEGRDYAGNVSVPLEIPIRIADAWWQTRLARALFLIAGVMLIYALFRWRLHSIDVHRRELAGEVADRTAALNAANTRLRELSYQDALTGLANRRALLEALQTAAASRSSVALILVDVDHFKDYNDHFGHPAGDEALCCVARTMLASAPPGSLLARYGGEEFAVLLHDCNSAQARALAEGLRAAVEVCDVTIPATAIVNHVSISAGVFAAVIASEDDAHRLLREADNKLYQAKNDGRNCVRG